jgi:hypothetical protein
MGDQKAQPAPAPEAVVSAPAEKPTPSELVKLHLKEATEKHERVAEHLAPRGIHSQQVLDPSTGRPMGLVNWKQAALLERFRAEGLTEHSRISAEGFEKAMDEALNGRI